MKKKLIITSLLALSACNSTSGTVKSLIPEEVDGMKVYTSSETKDCGMKDKDGSFIQKCDKKTGEFLNGIVYSRYDDKDEANEMIDYYKDGWETKYIRKENGIIKYESNYQYTKDNLENFEGKSYFDNGNIRCKTTETSDFFSHDSVESKSTCFYINGVLASETTMNRKDGTISTTYDPKGNVIIKATKPYTPNTKQGKDKGIEEKMVDKWTRYDANGNLFTGKVTLYHEEEPETISEIALCKNGKLDGERRSFPPKKDEKKSYDFKEIISEYKDGIKAKRKIIYKDNASFESIYVGDNEIAISRRKDNRDYVDVTCRYKGHDSYVHISGNAGKGFVELFEKDQTKSLCPDISKFVK